MPFDKGLNVGVNKMAVVNTDTSDDQLGRADMEMHYHKQ